MIPLSSITLGVLAGGRAARMGGVDKSWLLHAGRPLLEACLAPFPEGFAARLVSARAPDPRHAALGLQAVVDARAAFRGPVAGLEALAFACRSEWLLTVPVDLPGVPDGTLAELRAAAALPAGNGAYVHAADGPQPLLALWRAAALAPAATAALDAGDAAARDLVAALALARVDIAPLCLRNLNTPDSLQESSR